MRIFKLLGIFGATINILLGQVERIYDEEGHLRTINPINQQGIYEGLGITYYPNGMVEAETPYQAGRIHGQVHRYWADGHLKETVHYQDGVEHGLEQHLHPNGVLALSRYWEKGHLQGEMQVTDSLGRLRLLAWLEQDSVVFAQRYGVDGHLTDEKVGSWADFRVDSSVMRAVSVYLAPGSNWEVGQWQSIQVLIPGVPTSLVRVSCPDCGALAYTGDWPYPIRLLPGEGQQTLYVEVSLRTGATPALIRTLVIPAEW